MMKAPHGRVDYLLFLEGTAAGVIEAKKEGETLRGVQWQSAKYVDGVHDEAPMALEELCRSSTNRPEPRRTSRARSTPTRAAARCSRSTGRGRSSGELLPIEYDPDRTPEFLDAVIVNECHPSIYGA